MSFCSPFKSSDSVKLMFCVHPVHAAEFKSPTKRVGSVAAGEFGLDCHRMQSPEGRSNSKEFLTLVVKKLVWDARLKDLPLVLHVREACKTMEEATSQCIGALEMASCAQQRKIYLHCFCSSPNVADF